MSAAINGKDISISHLHLNETRPKENPINLKIQETLEKCENYFISWLGDSKLEKDALPSMVRALYEIIGRVDDESENDSSETEDDTDQITKQEKKNSKRNTKKPKRKDIKHPYKEAIKNADKGNVNPDEEDIKNQEQENIKNQEQENIKNQDQEDIKNPDQGNIKNPEQESIQNPEQESIKNPDQKNIKNPDQDKIKNPDQKNIKNPGQEDEKTSDKEDTVESVTNCEINKISKRMSENDDGHPSGKSSDESESTDEHDETSDDESGVHPYDLQRAVSLLVESFLNIQVGESNVAIKQLSLFTKFVKRLVEEDKSIQEFVPGFDFLKIRLEIHLRLKECQSDFSENELKSSCNDFIELSDKSKAIVFAAKWRFLELLDKRKDESLEALQNVANLDDSNYNWNYILCMRLRFQRRNVRGPHTKPDENEIKASVAAMEMSKNLGGPYHAMSRAALCQTISEVLRWRIFERDPDVPINFGQLTFESNDAMIKYLRKEARSALCRFPRVCFAEHMRYSEIFSSALPNQHRNFEIAILCMTFCLRIIPTNSKANHKMGILHLTGEKDLKEAIHFFRRAVIFGPRNYPGWMDLIQSLLHSHLEHADELNKIFSSIYEKVWSEKQITSFKLLQGCYLFMIGETNSAIEMWVSINSTSGNLNISRKDFFHDLSRIKSRHIWPSSAMNLEDVQKAIHEKMQQGDVPDNLLQTLDDEIKSVRIMQYKSSKRNPRENEEPGFRYFNDTGYAERPYRGYSESDKDTEWRPSSQNASVTATADMSSSRRTYDNSSFGRTNFYGRGMNSNNSRYVYRQRRRSPSPNNWRN